MLGDVRDTRYVAIGATIHRLPLPDAVHPKQKFDVGSASRPSTSLVVVRGVPRIRLASVPLCLADGECELTWVAGSCASRRSLLGILPTRL
jgi:hypothetical protein